MEKNEFNDKNIDFSNNRLIVKKEANIRKILKVIKYLLLLCLFENYIYFIEIKNMIGIIKEGVIYKMKAEVDSDFWNNLI